MAVALAYFSRAPVDGDYVTDVLPVVVLLGAGAGLGVPRADDDLDVRRDCRTTRAWPPAWSTRRMQVGGAFGLAVLATLASDRTETLRSHGDSAAQAATGGYQLAFLVAAGLVGAAILLATFVLRSDPPVREQARASARRSRRSRAR